MKIDISIILQIVIIVLLIAVLWQNEDNETQMLGWIQEYGDKVNSIETHLIKTDPDYVQVE